jgi:glycosyltransferase involved in cell wall biosynthesis
MNIGIVYQDQYPWDIRIEKFIQAFSETGYGVHVISRNRDRLPTKESLGQSIFVHRLYGGRLAFLRHFINFPAFISPFWLHKVLQVVRREKIGLLLVRDLPLSPTAVVAGRIAGIPVLMDMAEDYPAMILDTWTFRGPRPIDYLVRNPRFLRWLESRVVNAVDGIFVVSEPSHSRVERLVRKTVPIWVVSNTPRFESHQTLFEHPTLRAMRGFNGLKILYVGGLEDSRGLDVVIEAVRELRQSGINILFIIVGKGHSEDRLKAKAERYNIKKNILFSGFIDHKYVPSLIENADVCIVPHYATAHTNTTIPNKIFDYMIHSKPILVTQARTLKVIAEENKCGFVYTDKDFQELAALITKLMDPALRQRMGRAGYEVVRKTFNWEKDRSILLEAIDASQKKFPLKSAFI